MAEVPMSQYTCRWCGAPYDVPTEFANNPSVTKRCPSGHRWSDGTTVEDSLKNTQRYLSETEETVRQQNMLISSLRGQITKLKKAR